MADLGELDFSIGREKDETPLDFSLPSKKGFDIPTRKERELDFSIPSGEKTLPSVEEPLPTPDSKIQNLNSAPEETEGWLEEASEGVMKGIALMTLDVGEAFHEATGNVFYAPLGGFEGYEDMVENARAARKDLRRRLEADRDVVEGIGREVGKFLGYLAPIGAGLNALRVGQNAAKTLQGVGLNAKSATIVGSVAEGELAAITAENLAYGPYEARLSNLIESVPALQNPVTEFLQAREDESRINAEFRRNLEALGLGALTSPFFSAIALIKARRGKAVEIAQREEAASIREAVLKGQEVKHKKAFSPWHVTKPPTVAVDSEGLPMEFVRVPAKDKFNYPLNAYATQILKENEEKNYAFVPAATLKEEFTTQTYYLDMDNVTDFTKFLSIEDIVRDPQSKGIKAPNMATGGIVYMPFSEKSVVPVDSPRGIELAKWRPESLGGLYQLKGEGKVPDREVIKVGRHDWRLYDVVDKERLPPTKVVDEKGKPLLLYHGTSTNKPLAMEASRGPLGLWFTENPDVAELYAGIGKKTSTGAFSFARFQGNVRPAYVIMKNPYRLDPMSEAERMEKQTDLSFTYLKGLGHDGIISPAKKVTGETKYDEYIIFDNAQMVPALKPYTIVKSGDERKIERLTDIPVSLDRGKTLQSYSPGVRVSPLEAGGAEEVSYRTLKDATDFHTRDVHLEREIFRREMLLGSEDEAIRSLVGGVVENLREAVKENRLDQDVIERSVKRFEKVVGRYDADGKLFPEDVREKLVESIRTPPVFEKLSRSPSAVERLFRDSEEAIEEQARVTGRKILEGAERRLVDSTAPVKKALLKQGGKAGEDAVMRFELTQGAGAKADFIFGKWRGEIYGKLEGDSIRGEMRRGDRKLLDRIIQSIRGHEIATSSPTAGAMVGKGRGREMIGSDSYIDRLEEIRETVGLGKYNELVGRANLYFDAMKEQLADLHSAGLITTEVFKTLKRFRHQPRDYISMIDPQQTYRVGKERISVSSSGVEPLGRAGVDLVQTDSAFLLAQVISRTQGRIAKNEAVKALSKLPEGNGVVWNKHPRDVDVVEVSYIEKGKNNRVWMDANLAGSWISNGQIIAPAAARALSLFSGADVVRTLATGVNPEFVLVNLPRDLAYVFLTTNEYSPLLPKAGLQMGRDLISVMGDAVGKKGRYEDYIREGGGMSFLTHGARLHSTADMGKKWERVRNALGYVNETGEVLVRLAVRERALRNGATPEEATWHARRYIDFSQGGSATKFADSFMPYLNASVQGMRGAARAFKNRPFQTSGKVAQFGAATSLFWLYNEMNHPEVMSQVSPEEKARFWIFPTGQSYVDDRGNTRHLYTRVAVEHTLMPFKSAFEALMARGLKGEVPTKEMVESFKSSFSIVGDPSTALPPVARFLTQYMSNYDFYTNRSIWSGDRVRPGDEIRSFPNKPTTRMAVDVSQAIGKTTGIELSPERLEGSIPAIVPRNIYTSFANKGYEVLRGSREYQEYMQQSSIDLISRSPGARRLLNVTHPLSVDMERIEEVDREVRSEKLEINRNVDALATITYNAGRGVTEGPEYRRLRDMVSNIPPIERERVVNRYMNVYMARKNASRFSDVDYYSARSPDWWLTISGMEPRARAQIVYDVWRGIPTEKRSKFRSSVAGMPGGSSVKFWSEFNRLVKERGREFP